MNQKEVYFAEYCSKCKYKDLDEKFDPCNECLDVGAREDTHKPLYFEPKED